MRKEEIIDRVKDILISELPEFKDSICCRRASKNCFHLETLNCEDKISEQNQLVFSIFFKNYRNFIPSIFCGVGRCYYSPNPGKVISVRNLKNGVGGFISDMMIKEFLSNPLENSEFATT